MGRGSGSGAGKGLALSAALMQKILLSYLYVSIWIVLSAAVILYNKYILDRKMYNFPYPLTLTMFHMAFCSSLAFLIIRVFKWVEPIGLTREQYMESVVPIGMLKALMPVAVYSIGVVFKKEVFSVETMANMLGISVGVAVAAYGEIRFDVFGVILQLGAVATEATRLILVQILLTSKGLKLNPITSLYYISPACLAFLTIPWVFIEMPRLQQIAMWRFDPFVFLSNASVAFGLNLAVFLLIGKTSALTMNVAGVVKDWLLIAISWFQFKDPVTSTNLFGYSLAFLGVCVYNHAKLKKAVQKEASRKPEGDVERAEAEERVPLKDMGEDKPLDSRGGGQS
ncbi:Nucleotide-sugar transporter family protein [Klebsormidium nitens]|uniref:Nucleotide-sugar transporter family protein n=1 Tax=Klebsormidium nitens TaxID=105231 RepID=A0A1Y1HY15_KLENI|nr:Nucleotide-sugar transporter family protein [Klebsormidium nitens]|eukprot:GAQ82059.1 Nucleotide-sugar transporter family protein [Klebsormidium nitens]